jgi:cytidine deaminase
VSAPPHAEHDALVALAHKARANAYAPYSGFAVGAAIEAEDGTLFAGANVENASFPVGICAERTALSHAVTEGHRRFKRVAVVTDAAHPAFPCGVCRQALFEFGADLVVVVENTAGARQVMTLAELLPKGFGPGDWEPRPGRVVQTSEG